MSTPTTGGYFPQSAPGGGPGVDMAQVGFQNGDTTDVATFTFAQTNIGLWAPAVVSGDVADPSTPTIGLIGDSIPFGQGDVGPGANMSWWVRWINHTFGTVRAATPGQNVNTYATTTGADKRLAFMAKASRVVLAIGTNDLVLLGRSAAQLEADILATATKVIGRSTVSGLRVYAQTLAPRVTTTDNYATLANQTPLTSEAARVAYNDWLRAGAPVNATTKAPVAVGTGGALLSGTDGHPLAGYLELADTVESSRNSGKWKVNGTANYLTADGTHPNATGSAMMASGLPSPTVALGFATDQTITGSTGLASAPTFGTGGSVASGPAPTLTVNSTDVSQVVADQPGIVTFNVTASANLGYEFAVAALRAAPGDVIDYSDPANYDSHMPSPGTFTAGTANYTSLPTFGGKTIPAGRYAVWLAVRAGPTTWIDYPHIFFTVAPAATPQSVTGGSGLASSPAFGTGGAITPAAVSVAGSAGLASAPAFGSGGAVTPAAASVTGAAGLASAPTFGAGGAVTPQAASVAGTAGLASTPTFGAGTVTPSAASVAGTAGLVSAPAFGSDGSVTPPAASVAGTSGLASTPTFGVGAITPDPALVTGSAGLTSDPALGVGTVTPAAVSVAGTVGLASAPAFGTGGLVESAPAGIAGTTGLSTVHAFGAGVVTPDAVSVTGTAGLAATRAFGADGAVAPAPSAVTGTAGLASAPGFGAGTVTPDAANVSGTAGLASTPTFGVGVVTREGVVAGTTGLTSGPAFGTGSITPDPVTVAGAAGLTSSPALGAGGTVTAITANSVGGGTGLTSSPAFGTGGSVAPAAVTVTGATGLASSPGFGTTGAVLPPVATVAGASGLASAPAFGSGTVLPADVAVAGTTGLVAARAFGTTGAVVREQVVGGLTGLESVRAFGVGLIVPDAAEVAGLTGLAAPSGFGSDGSVYPEQWITGLIGLTSAPGFGIGGGLADAGFSPTVVFPLRLDIADLPRRTVTCDTDRAGTLVLDRLPRRTLEIR
jgi:lysophospholipase L1-like esterase